MNFIGYYFLFLLFLLVFSFTFWFLMQKNFKREITYGWITTIGFVMSVIWILYGVYYLMSLIFNLLK